MSIFASALVFDGDHDNDCPANNQGPCSCGSEAPLIYQDSHVLPTDTDPRGGEVDLSVIPGFVTREGRNGADDDDAWWPWLRVGVNSETVVLDRSQVRVLRDWLSGWIDHTSETDR